MRHRTAKLLAPVAGILIAVTVAGAGCSSHYRRYDAPYDAPYDARHGSDGYEYRDGGDPRSRQYGSGGGDVFTLAAQLREQSDRLAQMATGHRGEDRRHSENDVEELTRKFARRAAELSTNLQREGGRGARRDLEKLADLARDIDAEFRAARMPREFSDEWNRVLTVLSRLQRSLGSQYR